MREKDCFGNDIIYQLKSENDMGSDYKIVFIGDFKTLFGGYKDFNEFQIDSGESQYTYVSIDVCIEMYKYLKEKGLVKEQDMRDFKSGLIKDCAKEIADYVFGYVS